MENNVSLVKLENNAIANIKEGISKSIEIASIKLPSSVNTITLKVNLCYYWNASTGHTTDPLLVDALIDHLREKFGNDVEIKIAEADASAMQTKYAFPLLGYKRIATQKKVELLNLSEDTIEEMETQVNGKKMVLKIPKTLLESDLFINMPKLKVMRATHITCAMKNLFGAIALPRKVTYHPFLAETIVGVNKILKPHLNIVDGIVALGTHPVKLNLIMAGDNAFATDWVAAKVMGYNPAKIKFLTLAVKEQLGDPKSIMMLGEKVEDFSKQFPTENALLARLQMRLQLSVLKMYSKLSGDIIPPSINDV
jgi:uncharacterized protein (DUF362 family)